MGLKHKTIGTFLADTARENPHKTAVVYEDVSYTWEQVEMCSIYMAYRMFSLGISRGTHVGIWSVNTPNWIFIYLALVQLGAVPVLLNACLQERELSELIEYADVEYLYYGENYKNISYEDVVSAIRTRQNCRVKKWVYMGRNSDGSWLTPENFVTCEKTRKAVHLIRCLERENHSQDVAAMLFTSGTTARSKGVLLTHYNLVNTALATIRSLRWGKEERICITVPLFHCFGLTSSMLTTILLGSTMCVLPYYRTEAVLGCIERNQCTVINGVPSMFLAMMKNPNFRNYDTSSLRSGIIAGSPLYREDYLRLTEEIPTLTLLPSYGQTESSPAVTFARYEDSVSKRAENAGTAVENVEIRIVDVQNGKKLASGEVGEILVKGYNVMKGYYKLPELTKETIDSYGWLHTGDLGCLDADGYLYMKGRKKAMIIRAGENISPEEIVEVLREIPWIADAAVIGTPAPVIQEQVTACVILEEGKELQEHYVREYLKERLAHYKVPEDILVFREFPVTVSGKIILDELKAQAMERLNAAG